MQLTESGRRFLEYADKDIEDYYQVKKDILHIEQRQRKVVDLLSAYGIIRMVTPDCIAEFCKKYPDIEFHYRSTRICRQSVCLLKMKEMLRFPSENLMRSYIM